MARKSITSQGIYTVCLDARVKAKLGKFKKSQVLQESRYSIRAADIQGRTSIVTAPSTTLQSLDDHDHGMVLKWVIERVKGAYKRRNGRNIQSYPEFWYDGKRPFYPFKSSPYSAIYFGIETRPTEKGPRLTIAGYTVSTVPSQINHRS